MRWAVFGWVARGRYSREVTSRKQVEDGRAADRVVPGRMARDGVESGSAASLDGGIGGRCERRVSGYQESLDDAESLTVKVVMLWRTRTAKVSQVVAQGPCRARQARR